MKFLGLFINNLCEEVEDTVNLILRSVPVFRGGYPMPSPFPGMDPYLENPADWKGKQITEKNIREPLFLIFAGLRFPEAKYRDLYNRLISRRSPDDLKFRYDPFRLWLNMYITAIV